MRKSWYNSDRMLHFQALFVVYIYFMYLNIVSYVKLVMMSFGAEPVNRHRLGLCSYFAQTVQ
jgi:hypothetical protein